MKRKFSACNLIKQHVLILWTKKLVFHILLSHLLLRTGYGKTLLIIVTDYMLWIIPCSYLARCYFVFPKTWLVQFQIKYCYKLESNINFMVQHKSTVSKSHIPHIFFSELAKDTVSRQIPPCPENDIAINARKQHRIYVECKKSQPVLL